MYQCAIRFCIIEINNGNVLRVLLWLYVLVLVHSPEKWRKRIKRMELMKNPRQMLELARAKLKETHLRFFRRASQKCCRHPKSKSPFLFYILKQKVIKPLRVFK